jgi:transposase
MNEGRTVFAQLLDFLPRHIFRRCVERYRGNHQVKSFSCWDQFLCLAFAQLTYRESLRDIEACLRAMPERLYHMGIRGHVSRSTLADANEKRDWRIYADFAQALILTARELYAGEELGLDLTNTVYAFDSTTIDLCLSLFPWARFRKTKAAVKMHTLLDLRGSIPSFIAITDGKTHDVNLLDELPVEPGSIYVMDRGYLDFQRLYELHQQQAFFVTRAKSNTAMRRLYSRAVDKETGLRCDQTVVLANFYARRDYPAHLRKVRFIDEETENRFVFLSNLFHAPALTVAKLYKMRWAVELFFKWIKQHLRIKVFFGTSENAVKTQIWTAVSVYVLAAIVKKRLHLDDRSLYTILQILSVTLFEREPILTVLSSNACSFQEDPLSMQLELFNN